MKAASSAEQLEMGVLSQHPVTQQYFLCFLNAQGFFLRTLKRFMMWNWDNIKLLFYFPQPAEMLSDEHPTSPQLRSL